MSNNKNGKKYSFINCVLRILRIAFCVGPVYIIVNNLMAVVNGTSQGVITVITQKFFDTVISAVNDNSTFKKAIFMACVLAIASIIAQIINGLNNFMAQSYFKKITGRFNYYINRKSSRIEPIEYEDTDVLNSIEKASMGANNSLGLLFTVTTIFSFYSPYFIFMFVYLFSMDKMLAVSIIFVFLPVASAQVVRSIVFSKLEDKAAPLRRETTYYTEAMSNKETRIFGGFRYFKDLFDQCVKMLNKELWKSELKVGLIELGMKLLTVLGYLGIIILLVKSLYDGKIRVSQFAAVYASIDYMFSTMNTIISIHIANLTQNMGSIVNFLSFLDMPEREETECKEDKEAGIVFKNVDFSYPNSKYPSLSNITLNIKKGETIAVVGTNGSGKTTFAKLALGIYTPINGSVSIHGIDTNSNRGNSLFNNSSAVFQNFQKYKMTLFDNVTISDIKNKDKEKFQNAVSDVDLDYRSKTYPDQENTMLSRDFEGVDLSGGQWQKIAIARGLYKNNDIIVLDEPTAAIDPIEEAKVYKEFAELAEKKTAIIITHRIGSAKIADRILVLDSGKIAELGTHDELYNNQGKYYTMFNKQSKWYDSKNYH